MSDVRILKSATLDDGSIIELLDADYFSGNVVRNLIRRMDSAVMWEAIPPGVPDYFVDFRIEGTFIFANTFSGNLVEVDLSTGVIVSCRFVK